MRSNYSRLGTYIQPINIRNKDLLVDKLLGVSIKKKLMPSIANTIGTNMETYKIIRKNQFAYGPVTSRNGDKISVALLEQYDEAIISQAYTIFEVIDENELNPEYLMMWFRRPEFDRYARFKSHGSAREVFDWDEMCEIELPIPSIEKQHEIVAEYNTVANRIKLNEQLNKKLEETAQALYKHWFVDFEFPNEDGKPYKSSGGKMVFNEELDKEIPEGWNLIEIEHFAHVIDPHPSHRAPLKVEFGYPFAGIGDIDRYGNIDKEKARTVGDEFVTKQENDYDINENSIGYGRVGTVGKVVRLRNQKYRYALSPTLAIINPKAMKFAGYIYFVINDISFFRQVTQQMTGSTRPAIGIQLLRKIKLIAYSNEEFGLIEKFNQTALEIIAITDVRAKETHLLKNLREILLAKMTKVELEKEIA